MLTRPTAVSRAKLARLVIVLVMLTGLLPLAALAQEPFWVAYVAIDGNELYYAVTDTTLGGVITREGESYGWLVWDPRVLLLAFTFTTRDASVLGVTNNRGSFLATFGTNVVPTFPPYFSRHSNQLLYTELNGRVVEADDGSVSAQHDVYALLRTFDDSDSPELIASFMYTLDCASSDAPEIPPAPEQVFNIELGGQAWRYNRPTLALSPFGLLYSTGCSGQQTALMNLTTGASQPLPLDISWVKLSSDETRAAGIIKETLAVIDLETGALTKLTPSAPLAYHIIWDLKDPNILYFATRRAEGELPLSADARAAVVARAGEAAVINWQVGIYAYNLTTQSEIRLWEGSGYGIGSLAQIESGRPGLAFSLVEQPAAWAQAVADGSISDLSDDRLIDVNLYHLTFDGTLTLLERNVRRAAFSSSSAAG